jgi:hypothetical protein
MAITSGHFYSAGSDAFTILLCTDAAGFEFMRLPDGMVIKFAADPTAQLTDLQTLGLAAGSTVLAPGAFPTGQVDGEPVQIAEGYSPSGAKSTLGATSILLVRPVAASAADRSELMCLPFADVNNVQPANLFPPFIASVTPNTGPAAGGTPVIVRGTGFLNASAVNIGGACSGVVIVSDTEIHCNTHAHGAGAVHATVTTPGGTPAGTVLGDVFTFV